MEIRRHARGANTAVAPTAVTVRSAIALSSVPPEALLTAIGARLSPMTATTAPVTTGGIRRSIQRLPARGRRRPRRNDAAKRDAEVRIGALAGIAGGRDDDRDEREARAEVAWDFAGDRDEEDQGPDAGEEHRNIGIEAGEDRCEHGRAEHRDHVLEADDDHLRRRQTLLGKNLALALRAAACGAPGGARQYALATRRAAQSAPLRPNSAAHQYRLVLPVIPGANFIAARRGLPCDVRHPPARLTPGVFPQGAVARLPFDVRHPPARLTP